MPTMGSPAKTLDVKGLVCPVPVLKTKKAILEVNLGEVLEVVSTDPASESDIPSWVNRAGHRVIGTRREGNLFFFYVERGR